MKIIIIETDNKPLGTVSGSEAHKFMKDFERAMSWEKFLLHNYFEYQKSKHKK